MQGKLMVICFATLIFAIGGSTQERVSEGHKGKGGERKMADRKGGSSGDEAAIREVEKKQEEAWNQHDAKGYAALFNEDGDVVNVVGWWWKGRAEIEKKLTAMFAFVFAESKLTITEVHVKFLEPKIAVAQVRWTMVGAKTPKGIPEPTQGIQTQVLQNKGGMWQIAAFQNTNALPEVPIPTGPSAGH